MIEVSAENRIRIEKIQEFPTAYGRIGLDPILKPLLTLDEIRPTQILIPPYATEKERDRLITEGRVMQAQLDATLFNLNLPYFDERNRLGSGEFAFLVHPRARWEIEKCFPGLIRDKSNEEIDLEYNQIPPFRVARITGLRHKSGMELKGWIVASTFLPEQITQEGPEGRKRFKWVRENVRQTARLAYRLGADVVGTGALIGMLSGRGADLESDIPDLAVTTGHSYTCALIEDTLKEVFKRTRQDLSTSTIAILGAGGSIGSTVARMLDGQVGKLHLIDLNRKREVLEKLADSLSTPAMPCPVETPNDERYGYYLNTAAGVIGAATSAKGPFIRPEWLRPGVAFLDDAIPYNIDKGVAESRGGNTFHIVANIPPGFETNFPLSLNNAIFGCLAEVIAIAAQGDPGAAKSGDVTKESVTRIKELALLTGLGLGPMQSFENIKTDKDFKRMILASESANIG